MGDWTDYFRLRTRRYLDGRDTFPCGDILYMKNTKNFFAYIKKEDLLKGEIIIYDNETRHKTKYDTAGELFDAGWVVDMKKNRELRLFNSGEASIGVENQRLKFNKL